MRPTFSLPAERARADRGAPPWPPASRRIRDRAYFCSGTQQFVNFLTLGAIYALIALGYTMVYGIIELINFAHGDVFMVGAFLAMWILTARSG